MAEPKFQIKKDKVLVTGAGGFIGSHLVEHLLDLGYDVTCLIRLGENLRWLKSLNASLLTGDLTDKSTIYPCVREISYVYHLAARMGGYDRPSYIYNVNYEGTKNLAEVCLETIPDIKRFILVSSVAVTGPCLDDEVQDENTPTHPDTDYGKSKLMAEEFLAAFKGQIPYTIIRLPLVYGPRSDRGLCGLFKMAKRGLHIQIAQSSTNVAFVKDVVRGMASAAVNPVAAGQTYILGEDRIYDADEIIQSISRTLGKTSIKIKIPFHLLYGAVGFQEILFDFMRKRPFIRRQSLPAYFGTNYRFSTKKAETELCYKTVYPLERGLRVTAKWYKDNGYI